MADASLPSKLCTACGLCCSGALFDHGPLEPGEIASAGACGMRVLEVEDEASFALPCSRLEGTTCQIYADRPHTCRHYQCKTLRAAIGGEIDERTAFGRIADAREALGEVERHLPAGATIVDARRWRRDAGKAEPSATLRADPMLMLALGILDVVLDDHFRKPNQRQVMPRD